MGKSFGITAFVLLLISLPIPVLGNYLSLLAVLILAIAALQGEKMWVIITDLIAWMKMFLLSPTWHLMMFGGGYMRGANQEIQALGTSDAVTDQVMRDATSSMDGVNSMTLLITVAILAAPLAILTWRSIKAKQTEAQGDA